MMLPFPLRKKFSCCFIVGCAVLCGCGASDSPNSSVAVSQAATIAPADERLATLYKQTCKACHSIPNGAAPLVQDHSQWDARWSKGLPALLQSTISGLNGMPPGGQCFSCSAQDYEALIKFMAGQQ